MSYYIIFEDNSTFISKSNPVIDSKWNQIPNKLIKKIEYNYLGIEIILEGYESYNHVVGDALFILKGSRMKYFIKLLAKNKNEVKIFTWNLIKKEFTQEIKKVEDMKPSTGWKNGLKLNNPTVKINP